MLELFIHGSAVLVGTALESLQQRDIVIVRVHLVKPLGMQRQPLQQACTIFESGLLWHLPGCASHLGENDF